jgi:glycosyltransferase involved in cell wall biosynthesis
MIWLDVTKSGSARHRSGLTRVTTRLGEEFGPASAPVVWGDPPPLLSAGDWYLTAELFSEAERPGFTAFLAARPCGLAAIFHDAIPLRFPHFTWPRSVARHPAYLKLLSRFDRVWAVSDDSRQDLEGFWRWQGIERPPPVAVIPLGADFDSAPRPSVAAAPMRPPALLCVGILEPRKNQELLLDVCDELWGEGLEFELHLVGRVNLHFGRPLVARIKALARRRRGLRFHGAISDRAMAARYAGARASVFPTLAEGCGLPLLESLWQGVPCVGSDLPALRESAAGGGCVLVPPGDRAAWKAALRRVVSDGAWVADLAAEATARALPTWSGAAAALRAGLAGA